MEQTLFVIVAVVGALAYLAFKFFGRKARSQRSDKRPDVQLDQLTCKRKDR